MFLVQDFTPQVYLVFLADICLHDGVLPQQYDRKSVNVYRSF